MSMAIHANTCVATQNRLVHCVCTCIPIITFLHKHKYNHFDILSRLQAHHLLLVMELHVNTGVACHHMNLCHCSELGHLKG